MRKSFIKLFSFIMIILIALISACVLAYNYISDTIILNNEGENLTSILNSTNYVVNQKFENDFIYYNELIENITLSSETLEEKYETLNENKDKFVDLKTYDFGFGYLSTYLDGSECIRIGDVLYRDNNSRFNSKYLDNEVIMINFGRDCTTINDVPNKFEVKDYVLYRFGDIVIYIAGDDYFMNIFKSTETITVEDYFIVSGDGKVSFQDDVTSSTMFYQLLRNEGNNETNVNEIIDDFNDDNFDKKVYSGITYNDQTCHLLSSTIENEFFASDLIMVQIIASNITRYPIKKVATPLLAIFIIVIVITVIAITGSYLFINKKNNDINEMINNRINEKIFVVKFNKKGKVKSLNSILEKELVDPKKYDTILSFNIKEQYSNLINALNTKKRFTFIFPSEETVNGKLLVISFTTIKTLTKLILLGVDNTVNEETFSKLKEMALYDKNTNLPNLEMFLYDIRNKIVVIKDNRNVEKVALIAVEISSYKNYVNLYGTKVAEMIKQKFTECLTELLNDEKISLYQLDKTIYGITYEGLESYDEAMKIVDIVNEYFKKPIEVAYNSLKLDLRFGVYHLDLETYKEEDPYKIYDRLNRTLQRNKDYTLSNVEVYNYGVERYISNEDLLEKDIEKALEENEFEMYLQPQYSLEDENINGFEMLIRWNNSKYYNESPLHFITVAEHNGMMVKIGEFVIDQSMIIAKKLEKYNVTLSMNVSPVQLLQSGFVNELIQKANSYEIRKDSIALEITETYLMENFTLINDKLITLKKAGFKIHLDDFGTGYSSMLYLKELPIDVIKIDKEFIKFIDTDKYSKAICTKIISLGKMLELEIIAEGVENEKQLQYLDKSGCDIIQGYLVSRPVPLDKAIDLIEGYNVKKTLSLFDDEKKNSKKKKPKE